MADFVKVLGFGDLPEGSMKQVVVGSKRIALANVDGQVFAVDDTCNHEECSLANEGFLDGAVITCGCHGAQFDATSGKMLALPATGDLVSYETKVENGGIYVKI